MGLKMVRLVLLRPGVDRLDHWPLAQPPAYQQRTALRRCAAHCGMRHLPYPYLSFHWHTLRSCFPPPPNLSCFIPGFNTSVAVACFDVYPPHFSSCYAGFARSFTTSVPSSCISYASFTFCSQYPLPAAEKTYHLNVSLYSSLKVDYRFKPHDACDAHKELIYR
jgi:hypothetical protein